MHAFPYKVTNVQGVVYISPECFTFSWQRITLLTKSQGGRCLCTNPLITYGDTQSSQVTTNNSPALQGPLLEFANVYTRNIRETSLSTTILENTTVFHYLHQRETITTKVSDIPQAVSPNPDLQKEKLNFLTSSDCQEYKL